MSDTAKTLIDQALELPSFERAIVAEQLLLSLDRPDPEIDAAWSRSAVSLRSISLGEANHRFS
jgi:hypothetical protein